MGIAIPIKQYAWTPPQGARLQFFGEYFELLNDLLVKNCSENRSSFLVKKEIYEEAKEIALSGQMNYA